VNKRIIIRDKFGLEIEDEVVPDGGVCHVDVQFLDGRGTVMRDRSREAWERYCDCLANAHRAGKPRSKPLSDAEFSGTSRVEWAKTLIARQQSARKHV
jgi:hypothetical protein